MSTRVNIQDNTLNKLGGICSILTSDCRGSRCFHFSANLVYLAWAETAQCNLITTMAGYDEYAAKVRYRLIPGVW